MTLWLVRIAIIFVASVLVMLAVIVIAVKDQDLKFPYSKFALGFICAIVGGIAGYVLGGWQ